MQEKSKQCTLSQTKSIIWQLTAVSLSLTLGVVVSLVIGICECHAYLQCEFLFTEHDNREINLTEAIMCYLECQLSMY